MEPSDHHAIPDEATRAEINALLPKLVNRAPGDAAKMLHDYPDEFVAGILATNSSG